MNAVSFRAYANSKIPTNTFNMQNLELYNLSNIESIYK